MSKYSNSQSVYGDELDSLSDVICFGVFPAVITASISNSLIVYIICSFYMLCGVIRLAYFNMLNITKEGKKNTFVGLPITTVAVVYPIIMLIVRLINFELLKIVMPLVLLVLGICFISKFEMPKPDIGKIFSKIFNKYIVNFLIFPCFLIIGSDIFYKLNFDNFVLMDIFKTIIHNFIPFLLLIVFFDIIFLFLISLFKKSKTTKLIMVILTIIILTICDIKLSIMGNPIELGDVNYLNPANMHMMTTATGTIGFWLFFVFLKAIIFFVLGFIFVLLDRFNKIEIKNIKIRLLIIFSSIILIIFPFVCMKYINSFFIKNIYLIKNVDKIINKDNTKIYYDYGIYQGLYLNELSKYATCPQSYSVTKANEAVNSATKDIRYSKKWDKANVVFLLSESFSDMENTKNLVFNQRLTPNIDRYELEDDKIVGDLLVSTFGGVTVNTEFEILTGGSISFMKKGFIPWTEYYNDKNGLVTPNIIREFNNNNYETIYLTPWSQESYKSKYVFNLFGTDKTIYGDSLKGKIKGDWYSDMSLMDDIYNILKTSSPSNLKFIECATGQNHFPYEREYDYYDININNNNNNLSKEDRTILRTYAQGLYDADKSLNYLYNKIKKLDTPTVIVFFGDHLPYTVNSKGKNVYLESDYFNTNNEYLNNVREYTTKYVILANFDLGENNLGFINSSYLGAYIINKMDLKISDYFKFVDYTRTIIPAFNRQAIIKNDKVISLENMNKKEKEQLQKYKIVQYNMFYDFGY